MIGDAKPRENQMPPDRSPEGNDVRQSRPTGGATGWRTTPQSGHGRTSRRPCSRWLTQCLQCDFEFRSNRKIGPNGVRTRSEHLVHGWAAIVEDDEDDNRPPYTLWTCRLRTGCRCKSLSINTLSEDDKGYF